MSMFTAISWGWWAVGTFGLVGTGLLLWFAPAVLVKVVTSLLSFFLTNRWGNMIAVGLIVFFVADVNRSMRDAEEFKEKTADFEQAQDDRDKRIAMETRASVTKEFEDQKAADAATDTKVKDFTDALPPVPFADSSPFRVGDDACKLRALAGQAGCGPKIIPRRVPKAPAKPEAPADHGGFRLPGTLGGIFGRSEESSGSQRPAQ